MGRKGVDKRKRAKGKAAYVSGRHPVSKGRSSKAENQPEQVTEKAKAWPKGNRKG